MIQFDSSEALRAWLKGQKSNGQQVGLVPTMGALHDGHLQLVQKAKETTDVVIASIFVNPLQFNDPADLSRYPRQLDKDINMLEEAGCHALFTPGEKEIYPTIPVVKITFGPLAERLEGQFRPGHFDGVGVVVTKLFNLVQPDKAFFGLKDLQQYLLVRRMASDLSFPVEIVGCPTHREPDGLAMSSRNARLSPQGKTIAANISKGLFQAKSDVEAGLSLPETKNRISGFYTQIQGLEIEYCAFVDPETLEETQKDGAPTAVCVAAYVEGVRLIDNIYLRS
jgi:pantoate--beta-alanine ligase